MARLTDNEQTARRGGRYPIAVLVKALDLLDLLDAHESLTLTELSTLAGINKATSLRILANLDDRGYVERDPATARFRLGVRLLQLGNRKSQGLDLRTIVRPVLKRLHAEFDETVNLAIPTADAIVYIDILESARGLRMAASIGMRDDYHSTALGKAILAYAPGSTIDSIIHRPLLPKTPQTIVDVETLTRDLIAIRARGYATDDEENEPGARCLAAPIFDHRGTVIAAISISGPASRLSPARFAEMAARLTVSAREISTQMGFVETELRERTPDHDEGRP